MPRKHKGLPIHGWLVIDKPLGMTSTDVVRAVRRALGAQKAGHGGTLDPIATGILPLALGEATKTIPYLVASRKIYRFTVRWGEARTTDDADGAVSGLSDVRPSADAISAALGAFIGTIRQVPPAFSAVKVEGARAYDRAREGEPLSLAARPVTVYRFALLDVPDPDHALFEVECGKGAYVRALVRDLALRLGTLGHVTALRRTRVGPFGEADAIPLDKLLTLGHDAAAEGHLLAVEAPLGDIPAVPVTANDAGRLRCGQAILLRAGMPVPAQAPGAVEAPAVLCTQGRGRPVALCAYEAGLLRPVRVFNLH